MNTNKIDITGQVFGWLTAIEPTAERKWNTVVWRFKCKCGREVLSSGANVKDGKKLSCGQCGYMSEIITKAHKAKYYVKRTCPVCSKQFEMRGSRVYPKSCCSDECLRKAQSKRMSGANHPNWKGGVLDDDRRLAYAMVKHEWKMNNPERFKAIQQRAHAKRLGAEGVFDAEDILALKQKQNGLCHWCLHDYGDYHIDHVIPLARGGTNWPINLVLSCHQCNIEKWAFLPEEWFARPDCRARNFDYPGKQS